LKKDVGEYEPKLEDTQCDFPPDRSTRGVTRVARGSIPRSRNHYGPPKAEWLRGRRKGPAISLSTFFNRVHLLPKRP